MTDTPAVGEWCDIHLTEAECQVDDEGSRPDVAAVVPVAQSCSLVYYDGKQVLRLDVILTLAARDDRPYVSSRQ